MLGDQVTYDIRNDKMISVNIAALKDWQATQIV